MCLNKLPVKIGQRFSPLSGRPYPIYEYVSCRKCEECVSIRKSQWCFRILEESKHATSAWFVTLTYDNDHLPQAGVSVRDCQLFFKRLRKKIKSDYPEYDTKLHPLRYFLVSEYGGKHGRPHYHLIMWNCPVTWSELRMAWKNGAIRIGDTCEASVQYCLKYFAVKESAPNGKISNFCLMSKNIGHQWLADNLFYVKSYVILPNSKAKIPIPTYYRRKLNYPKREYDWKYEPDPMERFSLKYLRIRGLATRRCFNKVFNDPEQFTVLLEDANNYYLYRDEVFHRKYDKMRTKDEQ